MHHRGRPITRASLVLLAALWLTPTPGEAQSAGREPGPGVATSAGTTTIDLSSPVSASGVLRLWRAYSSGGGRAMLKVFRPEGERLVLVGTSPLEAVPPGEVATFACSIPVARNDLVGCYCPDANCLDELAGGTSLVGAGDLGTTGLDALATIAGGAALAATTSAAFDGPSAADRELVVPVVARTPGAYDTDWRTSLELFNTAATATEAALFFNLSGRDNTSPAASARVEVPARGVLVVDDLMADLFHIEQATGSLDVVASAPLLGHARIANVGGGAGSFGQLVPAVPASWSVGDDDAPGLNPNGDLVYLFEAREDDAWRTNLGVTNTAGVELTVELRAYAGTGALGESFEAELPPYSHLQLNHVLDLLGVGRGTSRVRITVAAAAGSGGRFLAYASRADNRTGDAVFILGAKEAPLSPPE